MIKQQIQKDLLDMVWAWGRVGVRKDGMNDLYNCPAYTTALRELTIAEELEKAEEQNNKDFKKAWKIVRKPIKPIVSTEEISALEEQGVNCNIRSIIL